MKLLLDTHTILWAVHTPDKLSTTAAGLIEGDNELLISVVSFWEIVIKVGIGKMTLAAPLDQAFAEIVEALHAELLPVEIAHVCAVAQLPRLHADPFDRLMIAQSIVENAPLLTADVSISKYPVPVVW